MFFLHSACLVVAVTTASLIHGAPQDFYGPGLGGMSYHPYPSRSAYIPVGGSSSVGPLPIREPPHPKQTQPLLHDFHTPVQKGLGVPPQFPIKDGGIYGGYPGPFNGPARDLPFNGGYGGVHDAARGFVPHGALDRLPHPIRNLGHHGAYGGVRDSIRNLGPHGAYGDLPLKNVGPQGAYGDLPLNNVGPHGAYGDLPLKNVGPLGGFGGVGGPLPPSVKNIDVAAGPVPNALTEKNIALQNPVTGTLAKDTLHGARLAGYPNQVGKDIGYPAHGSPNGPFFPRGHLGDFHDQGYGPGLDKSFGGFGGQRISEPFLTPIGRFSGGYEYHRVPLALVQGSFIGHHFGTPVVHGIVKAGVPVSLARGW